MKVSETINNQDLKEKVRVIGNSAKFSLCPPEQGKSSRWF